MPVVHKVHVNLNDEVHIVMPTDAKIVMVGDQQGAITIWFEHDNGPLTTRTIYIHGTGHHIPAGRKHVGSLQQGEFVWHLYENA
jgi:hypothetical protein